MLITNYYLYARSCFFLKDKEIRGFHHFLKINDMLHPYFNIQLRS